MKRWLLLTAVLLTACDDGTLSIYVTEADEALLKDGVAFIGDERLKLVVTDNPRSALGRTGGAEIAVVSDSSRCDDCYRLDAKGKQVTAQGGGVLGRQYAAWHALELFGYRYTNPWYAHVPEKLNEPSTDGTGRDFAPELKKRRGLHLHTLHPTEQYQYVWEPSAKNLEGALRTVDFVVKNRGNYLQWCALDNIDAQSASANKNPDDYQPWAEHTRAITSFAHAHGVKTGIALQLFGESNLQYAFDLIDHNVGDVVPEIERRLHVLLDGNGFDTLNLSFGEFFEADVDTFVGRVNEAYAAMQRVQPGVEVTATIHVGNYENLRVSYMGEEVLYYFLVKFADPAIVPWVHTTMFYNLYEDAGLAYLHEEFDEHRDYLESLLAQDKVAGYFPESSYWVAFDINVPLYLPLYIRSRHLDLTRLTKLDDHVLFSSGWEWGYWLTDAATLRLTYTRAEKWDDVVKEIFSGWGETGAKASSLISRLGEAQHRALILERLTAYIVGRDAIIDGGDTLGIFSQPDRYEFTQVLALSPEERAAFRATVVDRLKVHADELTALAEEAEALPEDDRVMKELLDGVVVTASRARFAHTVWKAAADFGDGLEVDALLEEADTELAFGGAVTLQRRTKLWHHTPVQLVQEVQTNATFYLYGYLREADTLCFWQRERNQLRNAVKGQGLLIPNCVL